MSKIVANMSEVHRVGHIGSGRMPHPMRRGILDQLGQAIKFCPSIADTRCSSTKHFLDEQMHRTSG